MKNKNLVVTILIIAGVIAVSFYILSREPPEIPEEVAKCIGENSVLYTKLGCHFCETQEELFGDSYKYLTVIDCFFENDKCGSIRATPTWLIDGKYYEGWEKVKTIQELTGCH